MSMPSDSTLLPARRPSHVTSGIVNLSPASASCIAEDGFPLSPAAGNVEAADAHSPSAHDPSAALSMCNHDIDVSWWSRLDFEYRAKELAFQHNHAGWREFSEKYARGVASCCPAVMTPEAPLPTPDGFRYLRAPMHPREVERRHALYRYGIVKSTRPRDAFHHLTALTRRLFGAMACIISLVDDDYQWYVSDAGFAYSAISRELSLCGHALVSCPDDPEGVFVVLDCTKDWRFRNNPLVTGHLHLRCYIGAKLVDADADLPLGTLCIFDDQPREQFTQQDKQLISDLAKVVLRELKLWRAEQVSVLKAKMQTAIASFTERTIAKRDSPSEQESFSIAVSSIRDVLKADLVALVQIPCDEDDQAMDGGTLAYVASDVPVNAFIPTENGTPVASTTATAATASTCNILTSLGFSPAAMQPEPYWPPAFLEPACASPDGIIWQDVLAVGHQRRPDPSLIPVVITQIGGICSGIAVPVYRVLGERQYTVRGSVKDNPEAPRTENEQPFAVLTAFWRDSRCIVEDTERRFLQGFSISLTALTQRSRVELANRSKSSFVNSISHELRTPLHGILVVVELLEDTQLSSSQRQFLRTIESCGKSLASIINHVLDFAKIEYGRMQVLGNAAPVDLWELAQEVADTMAPTVCESVKFSLIINGGCRWSRWCITDNGPLRQLLLIGNALKFTTNGRVDLQVEIPEGVPQGASTSNGSAEPKRRIITFRVADTGPGMSQQFQKKLCQPFSQEDPLANGTGLGLVIVRFLVQAMGGDFIVQSTLDVGSVFEVRIPVGELPVAEHDLQRETAIAAELQLHRSLIRKKVTVFTTNRPKYASENIDWDDNVVKRGVAQELGFCCMARDEAKLAVNPHLRHAWPPEMPSEYSLILIDDDVKRLVQVLKMPGARIFALASLTRYADMVHVCEQAGLGTNRRESRSFAFERSISQFQPCPAADNDTAASRQLLDVRCVIAVKPSGPGRLHAAVSELLGESADFEQVVKEDSSPIARPFLQTVNNPRTEAWMSAFPPDLAASESDVTDSQFKTGRSASGSFHSCKRTPIISQTVHANANHDVTFKTKVKFVKGGGSVLSSNSSRANSMTNRNESCSLKPAFEKRSRASPGVGKAVSSGAAVIDQPRKQKAMAEAPRLKKLPRKRSFDYVPTQLPDAIDHGLAQAGAEGVGEAKAGASVAEFVKPTVLIVEDNRVNRDILVAFIRRMQLEYDVATNGFEAVQAFENRGRYDAILMDIQMPVMDGNEATVIIREIERERKEARPSCIWALTGLASRNEEDLIRRSGADTILTKPVSLKQLMGLFVKQWPELSAKGGPKK